MMKKVMEKRNAKRWLAILLTAGLMAGALSGCGQSEKSETKDNPGANVAEEATAEGAATEEAASEPAPSEDAAPTLTEEEAQEPAATEAPSEEAGAGEYEKPAATDEYRNTEEKLMAAADEAVSNGEACWEIAPEDDYAFSGEEYEKAEENGFFLTTAQPLSTFSADVDTASYANVRRMIEDGYAMNQIPADAVRAEEFINYFSYDLKLPKRGELFGVTTEIAPCPWNDGHHLMMVGMKTEAIDMSEAPDSNLVFLLDVSGSMSDADKLPLLQDSFKELAGELGKDDTISIVTYASGVETVLKGAKGSEKEKICEAIDNLYAAGGTNGEDGIQRAYKLAETYFIKGGNNRVILATDGDLNIGISEPDELERFIEEKRESGVYLSVLGFGTGNIKDNNMERLADCGNGNYAYIDSLFEAKKVLVEEMGATLLTVAEDVKLQVEFNPDKVNAYRLIGYENRMLDAVDFNDDTKDAGEIGAGHTVVALYEMIPVGSRDEIALKYQGDKQNADRGNSRYNAEFATVSVRYKEPGKSRSKLKAYVVDEGDWTKNPSDDYVFASLVAEFAMILSDSPNKGDATLEGIMENYSMLDIDDEYKDEFYYLVKLMAKR